MSTSENVSPGKGPRLLHGDLALLGMDIIEHERFQSPLPIGEDPETLSLVLNLKGTGSVYQGKRHVRYRARTGGLCFAGRAAVRFVPEKETSDVIVVRWSRNSLRSILAGSESLPEPVRVWLETPSRIAVLSRPAPLDAGTLSIVQAFYHPPIEAHAATLWFQSRSSELLALWLFGKKKAPRGQVTRRQDVVSRCAAYLEKNFTKPWALSELAREIGCSPFYLSRAFATEKGMTIKQFLRELRLIYARDLLRSGAHTVTSAGAAVGYRSLSHFSMAFTQRWGSTPETILRSS